MKKILVLTPRLFQSGGISNYYKAVREYLPDNYEYFPRGRTKEKEGIFFKIYRIFLDLKNFLKKIKLQFDALIINTSLGKGGVLRDSLFIVFSPGKVKKIIFFRGWDPEFEKKIDSNFFLKQFFINTFLKADQIIVLSSKFKEKLINWGYDGNISIETTVVDEALVENLRYEKSHFEKKRDVINILYLGNISPNKGVVEIVEAYKILKNRAKLDLSCTIAGKGSILEYLKNFSLNESLDIFFPGYVTGEQKINVLKNSDLYVFASLHEGMPNSILEAMAFGLPVLTTRVGGLPDFFAEGKMGFFLESRSPECIAEKIKYMFERPELMSYISRFNYKYAKDNFYAGTVAMRMRNIIESNLTEAGE